MYKLVNLDGIHDTAVSDSMYHGMGEGVRRLYVYDGEDGVAEPEDPKYEEKDSTSERDYLVDGMYSEPTEAAKSNKEAGEQRYDEEGKSNGEPGGVSDLRTAEGGESGSEVSSTDSGEAGDPASDKHTHTITQEDLDNNPELVSDGLKVGDEVNFSPLPKQE